MTQTLYSLDSFGILQVTGSDALKLLQGQTTINFQSLSAGQLATGAICNPQGRCISVFFAVSCGHQDAPGFWLIMEKSTLELTLTTLKKYAIFYQVKLSLVSEDHSLFGFFPSHANLVMQGFQNPQLGLGLVIAAKSGSAQTESIKQFRAEQDWLFLLAEKGIAWLDNHSQQAFLPHDLNLPEIDGVDFKKGCFTGQEIIARMHYKAKLKSHLQIFYSETAIDPTPRQKVMTDDQVVGELICAANHSSGKACALVLVKDNALSGQSFTLDDEKASILSLSPLAK